MKCGRRDKELAEGTGKKVIVKNSMGRNDHKNEGWKKF